ncbi:MAG: hypothetical protein ABFS09_00205 [Thermodesulfobacteriota bacterium]
MKEKDKWDKFSIISGFLSGIVIATIGIVFTVSFSSKQTEIAQKQTELTRQQIQVSQIQTLEAFIPYLEDDNAEMRKFAAQRIADAAGADYATELENIVQSNELKTIAEDARAKGLGVGQHQLPEARTVKSANSKSTKEGWVYLGNFENGVWKTQYLDFDINVNPSTLDMTIQTVKKETGSLNVRKGIPNVIGQFPKVIDVLKVGSEVEILDHKEWLTSGYMWARVKYSDK